MAYSSTCAVLRTVTTIIQSVSGEMLGFTHRTIGSMMREDLVPEPASEDAEKITAIQTITGSQYFQNTAARVTGAMEAGLVVKNNGKGNAAPYNQAGHSCRT